jgi:hypothetical protein
MTDEHKALLMAKCSTQCEIAMPTFATSPSDKTQSAERMGSHAVTPPPNSGARNAPTSDPNTPESDGEDEEAQPEQWDLRKILSIQAVSSDAPIKCGTDTCLLPAACGWVSNLNPTKNWYTCLDCQVGYCTAWLESLFVSENQGVY